MEFSSLDYLITKLEKIELPGESFHYQLAPLFRQKELETLSEQRKKCKLCWGKFRYYTLKNGEIHMAFILRKTYKGVHSNQIGFPGGRYEEVDLNLERTALRETEEEIGVKANKIKLIKPLTQLYIPPSNFLVHPFLGYIDFEPSFVLQESEVEHIIEIPLAICLDKNNLNTEIIQASYAKNVEVPAFNFNGNVFGELLL